MSFNLHKNVKYVFVSRRPAILFSLTLPLFSAINEGRSLFSISAG